MSSKQYGSKAKSVAPRGGAENAAVSMTDASGRQVSAEVADEARQAGREYGDELRNVLLRIVYATIDRVFQ